MRIILDHKQQSRIRWALAVFMVGMIVLNWLEIGSWRPRGGCDGGLCALAVIDQLIFSAALWLMNIVASIAAYIPKESGPKKYIVTIVLSIVTLITTMVVVLKAESVDRPIMLTCWPAFVYAAVLLVLCISARRWLYNWEEMTEEDLLT